MKLDQNGKCPVCRRKPLTYKRDKMKFCVRCDRRFNLDSGEWEPNTHWQAPDEPTESSYLYGEPRYATPCYWTPTGEQSPRLPAAVFYPMKRQKQLELQETDKGFDHQNDKYVEWMKGWERHETPGW